MKTPPLVEQSIRRRRHLRHAVRVPVHFGVERLDREALADSLSLGGLHLAVNEGLPVGTRLRLAIHLAGRTVHHDGEVVWAIQVPEHMRSVLVHGLGVRFVGEQPEWNEALERWCGEQDRGD